MSCIVKPTLCRVGVRLIHGWCRIGNRDVVSHGVNGSANYNDNALFPFPAVRFRENNAEISVLREKEKGDWTCLSTEEKKDLYRASFCCTYAEFMHPTGHWKLVVGGTLIMVSFAFWCMMFYHFYVKDEPPPFYGDEIAKSAQLRRMLELRVNPVDGISSKWDYANDRWK